MFIAPRPKPTFRVIDSQPSLYERRRAAGICVDCGENRAEAKRVRCTGCLAINNAKQKDKRNTLRDAGKCWYCERKLRKDETPREACADCKKYFNQDARDRRTKLLNLGLCIQCGVEPEIPGATLCNKHEEDRRQSRERYEQRRQESGLCRKCPEPVYEKSSRYCKKHYELNLRLSRRDKMERRLLPTCWKGGCDELKVEGKQFCQKHLDERAKYLRDRAAEKRAIGECLSCPKKAVEGKRYCQYHLDKRAAYYRKKRTSR